VATSKLRQDAQKSNVPDAQAASRSGSAKRTGPLLEPLWRSKAQSCVVVAANGDGVTGINLIVPKIWEGSLHVCTEHFDVFAGQCSSSLCH
jgi:hypothetical protein